MKHLLVLSLVLVSHLSNAQEINLEDIFNSGGREEFIPVQEEPGPDAEVRIQDIHVKQIEVPSDQIRFKWTELGYGALTYKVIIPVLAAHTLFNHRNYGEEGPCLRSYRQRLPLLNPDSSLEASDKDLSQSIEVTIKASNMYRINQEKRVCKVSMVEDVETIINGERFHHRYQKDMGFRLIDDCLID